MPAAASIRRWLTARSAAPSPTPWARRSTKSSPISEDGSFLSGTFADYLVPTACEVPDPLILHRDSLSPVTPLGAKGVGEGNCMTTPVCIANAVADALEADSLDLPLTPARIGDLIHGPEAPPPTTGEERLPSL